MGKEDRGAVNIVVWCENKHGRFDLEKRGLALPEPGTIGEHTFDIPKRTTVLGFIVEDAVTLEKIRGGGHAQAFASKGIYIVQLSPSFTFPSQTVSRDRERRRKVSARMFHRKKAKHGP